MADFNVDLQAPQGAGASPVAPVSSGFKIPGLVEDIVGVFAKGLQESRKEKAEAIKQAVVGEYAQKLSAIEDAQISGQWNASRVNTERRKLHSQFVASNPEFVKDFKEISSSFLDAGGVKEALDEEQMKQDERKAERKDMINSGMFIPEWASPELEESMRNAYRTTKAADVEFKRATDRTSELRAQKQEMRTDERYTLESQVERGIGSMMTTHFEPASLFVNGIADRAREGADPKQLLQDIGQYFANIEAGIAQISIAKPSTGEAARNSFGTLRAMAEEAVSSKKGAESLRFRLEEMQSGLKLSALSNSPQLQTGYVLSTLMPGIPLVNTTEYEAISGALLKLSGKAGQFTVSPDLFLEDNMTVNQGVFDQLVARGRAVKAGKVGDVATTTAELTEAANNVNKTVGGLNVGSIDPKNLSKAAEYYSSPEFLDLVRGGKVDINEAQKAKEVMQLTYEKDVIRGVEQQLSRQFSKTGKLRPEEGTATSNLVNITFNGASVEFKMKDVGYLSPIDRQDFKQIERQLSASKQALNQLIRMSAHLDKREDYAQYFEENKHVLLPSYFPDPNKLKPGQTVKAKNGKSYKYIGGNYNDIQNSYEEVSDGGER